MNTENNNEPIIPWIIKKFKERIVRQKEREIKELELDIKKAKLEKELRGINK